MRDLDAELVFQMYAGWLIKSLKAEVVPESLLLLGFRRGALWPLERQHGSKAKLPADVIENPDRDGSIFAKKSSVLTKYAKLDGKPATAVVAAAAQCFYPVGWRERPVPGQILLCGIFRQRDGRAALPRTEYSLRGCGQVVIWHVSPLDIQRTFFKSPPISSADGCK